jgi:hypothetical protein
MIELVLQAAGQQPVAFDGDGLVVKVHPGDHRMPGPRGRQEEARASYG